MPRKSKDPGLKFILRVSDRDRRIYEEVEIVGRTQHEVAAEFKISQARVSKIVQRVFRWMSETAPAGLPEVPRPQRLYGVARAYKQKLEYYEREAKEAWRHSKTDAGWSSTHDVVELPDSKATLSPGKVTRKAPKPDVKYLNAAQKYAATLVEFEGFAKDGSVARNNDDRLHEVPQVVPGEELDLIIKNGKRAEEIKRQREANAASAAAPPSPRYPRYSEQNHGERDGVRGGAGTNSNHSQDSLGVAQRVGNSAEHVPTPAPHPHSGIPGRGDSTADPSVAVLLSDSAETHLERENAAPNEFSEGLLNAGFEDQTAVASATAAPSPRYSGERVGVRGGAGTNSNSSLGSSRLAYGVDSNAKSVPTPAPHPNPLPVSRGVPRVPGRGNYIVGSDGRVVAVPPPKKVYPPSPPGYLRIGDKCRPVMQRREQVDPRTLKPGKSAKPPRYYQLSEDGKEWWSVS